ncbi:MAG: class I SAM-dependent methyltransferase [Acidobacteria bacterium]|nr:class I SAM-dependent methyltransferase [Acidobacteriota bacterium]
MTDPLPPGPAPIPPPDRYQIERINSLYDVFAPAAPASWRGRLADRLRAILARVLFRQREFNAAVADHINRNDVVAIAAHHASATTVAWVHDTVRFALDRVESQIDEMRRHQEALAAWERRSHDAVTSLAGTHEELRAAVGVLQRATQTLKREMMRLAEAGPGPPADAAPVAAPAPAQMSGLDSHTYVGFEDQFRGSPEDIRARVAEYLPLFHGSQDVLDIGCGRGEFLALLRDQGVTSRGVDLNGAMVDVCREQGLDAEQADALAYLRAQPDGSLGGIFAAQVVEHLEPRYLTALLDTAFDKLRPGAPIVLETINPACWFAFFESYIRDITHVRPLHPDTLKYLMIANGFQHVDIRYRSPYPEHEKLQPLAPHASLGAAVDTLNANVERLNRLLFTWLDYAAIGRRA